MPTKRTQGAIPSSPLEGDDKAALKQALVKIRALEREITRTLLVTQEKVQQLEYLTQLSSLLNSTLDPGVVREKALEATCQLLKCETASLLLVDPKTGELYWETALGQAGQELKTSHIRLAINDRSIAGYVAMSGESLVINDVQNDPRHNKKPGGAVKGGFKARSMICVPLKAKDRTIGVLQALNKLPVVPARASRHEWPDFYGDDLQIFETLSHQVAVAIENSGLYVGLKKSFYDTVESLAEAIEKKDSYTGGHTKRVVYYSMCVAKYLDLCPEMLERIRLGALLHDVGKIGVEDKVLKKPAPLDPEEWKQMQKHPELGWDIMSRVESLKDVIGGMRYHHERWDGKGYPLGMKGEEIPFIARVIAVADTYDAMVSTRPYRKGLEPQFAHDEICRGSGSQFDPRVVEAFKKAFTREKMGKGSGQSKGSILLSNCD